MACRFDGQRLEAHVFELCRTHKIVFRMTYDHMPLELAGGYDGHRRGEIAWILARRVVDDITYAIALHEIGHIIHPRGSIRTEANQDDIEAKMVEEHAAWEWAKQNALDWTVAMEQVKETTIGTYKQELRMAINKKLGRGRESINDFLKRR